MNIAVRVDSSTRIGSGHVMRCLTLAEGLRDGGTEVRFICRDLPGNICDLIERKGFVFDRLSSPQSPVEISEGSNDYSAWLGVDWTVDARESAAVLERRGESVDWLVVDHYALDSRWEEKMRCAADSLFVIDDLANRRHDCDLLLDQNLYPSGSQRYARLVSDGCRLLCGPEYALLRKEFIDSGRHLPARKGTVRRLLVFFGGVDRTNETGRVCEAILSLDNRGMQVDVVVGPANPNGGTIRRLCLKSPQFQYHCRVDNMADLMLRADLAIGAGGTTTWERAYLGLPAIIVAIAGNQIESAKALDEWGAVRYLGYYEDVAISQIAQAIRLALDSPTTVESMSRRARELFGARPTPGVEKVVQAMKDGSHALSGRL